MRKLRRKAPETYNRAKKKIFEILTCKDPQHYKNLRGELKHLKRVHVDSSFVLLSSHNADDSITLYTIEHHDDAYN